MLIVSEAYQGFKPVPLINDPDDVDGQQHWKQVADPHQSVVTALLDLVAQIHHEKQG
jgi:hypothetical protein